MTAIAPSERRWVFGPIPDLLLGCGVGYAVLIALLPLVPLDAQVLLTVGTFGTLLLGAPHYGATLLRVYGSVEDCRKYAFFTIYLSAIVWLWFVVGLHDLLIGSAMITLYLTWSPWHYTGQNYGLAVMFLRRRGIPFSQGTKRLLYASFGLSYALAFLSLHRHHSPGGVSYGVGDFSGTPFYFIHLGLPPELWRTLFLVVGIAYLAITAASFARLLRSSRASDLVPVAALVVAQALWFSVPYTWTWMTNTLLASRSASWLFIWAILGHSVQYLWITTYYAVGRKGGRPRWKYLAATLGAGSAIWTVPALVFSPQLLGTHPYNMGLLLMIAAAVNLQHFILDGAIWKLRDTGVGRILLAGSAPTPAPQRTPGPERTWRRDALWLAGALLTAVSLYGAIEQVRFSSAVRNADFDSARAAANHLASIARRDPHSLMLEGQIASRKRDFQGALAAYQASIDFYPTSEGYLGLGLMHQNLGEFERAEQAFRTSIALQPDDGRAYRRLGRLQLATGRPRSAVENLERASRLLPGDAAVSRELARARAALRKNPDP